MLFSFQFEVYNAILKSTLHIYYFKICRLIGTNKQAKRINGNKRTNGNHLIKCNDGVEIEILHAVMQFHNPQSCENFIKHIYLIKLYSSLFIQ